ncbi:hypothetical protein LEP1GSC070_2235 [Leptospira santarosai str. AIM]|nr:hypothetical protein LEP1GSC070_2235 [Leptospira santarosai str. AIM]
MPILEIARFTTSACGKDGATAVNCWPWQKSSKETNLTPTEI